MILLILVKTEILQGIKAKTRNGETFPLQQNYERGVSLSSTVGFSHMLELLLSILDEFKM